MLGFPIAIGRAWPCAALLSLVLTGCALWPERGLNHLETAPSASTFWTPPRELQPKSRGLQPSEIPEELKQRAWGLWDVLDLALRNSPVSRATWADARAALANYGVERGALYPQVDLEGSVNAGETYNFTSDRSAGQVSYGPAASLSWLLFDFGTRSASIETARYALFASNWTHNGVIQDTVLQVEQAYYQYMAAKALREARLASLQSAELNVRAAQERHSAGVATIADVLQARTAASQAKLALQTAEGSIQTTRGSLAASMGLPANIPFDIEEMPSDIAHEGISQRVDELIEEALGKRPDLAAARAQVLASETQIRRAEGQGLPTVTLGANTGVTGFDVQGAGNGATSASDRTEGTIAAGLTVHFPLFTGYSQTYNVERARAAAEAARARASTLEQQAIFQVFAAYYALETATQKVRTAKDLLASAEQSEAVARGRYREGVGTILDLVTAESALADARAQGVQARLEWYTAFTQLAHDTGLLGLHGESPLRK